MKEYKVIAHKQLENNLATLTFNVEAESIERAREIALFELSDNCPIYDIEYIRHIKRSEFEVRAFCSNDDEIGESKVITVKSETYDKAKSVASLKLFSEFHNVVLTQVKAI